MYSRDDDTGLAWMKGMTTQVLKGCKGPADTIGTTTHYTVHNSTHVHRFYREDRDNNTGPAGTIDGFFAAWHRGKNIKS